MRAAATNSRALEWVALLAVILGCAVLSSALLTRGHDWGDDFASYLMQAQSIANGTVAEFVEQNRFTIEQSSIRLGPIAYPWGAPLLLAVVYWTFGFNLLAFKALNIVLYVVFLAVIALYLRRRHSFAFLVAIIVIFSVNPVMLASLNEILSDIPFLLFSTMSIAFIGLTIVDRRVLLAPWIDRLLLGVLMAVSVLTRTAGVALVATSVGTQIVAAIVATIGPTRPAERRRRVLQSAVLALLPYLAFAAVVILARATLPDEQASYWSLRAQSSGAPSAMANIIATARYYFELPVDFVGDVPYPSAVYFATLPFVFAGVVNRIRYDYHVVLYAFVTLVGLCVVWQGQAGLRFLFPLLPFYVDILCAGLAWYAMALGGLAGKAAKVVALCVFVGVVTYWVRTDVARATANITHHRETRDDAFAPTTLALYEFVRANVPDDAVIAFFKPRAMRLVTRRQSVAITDVARLSLGDYLCIFVGRGRYRQIPEPVAEELVAQGELTRVYVNPDFRLYRINKSRSSARDGAHRCVG